MNQILIFILGVGVGGVGVWLATKNNKDATRKGLLEEQAEEKRRNKEAILGLLKTKSPITNNHVEQLLGVSDATAERYLQELEQEGRVRQVGKTGQAVYYERT